MTFDVIVIGSGFGGAVTACRLQERGYRVLVLERGRRWDKTNFPRQPSDPWLWDSDSPERCNGWLELRHFPNMSVATGAAVGGGSLI
jgi:cholesterol oxidase